MAKLNDFQKITRVRPTKPFGNGQDGTQTSSGAWISPSQSCSGTAAATTLTIAAAGSFADDDLVLIHQTRGTGVGQWEINLITSGGGTTTLTLQSPLQYTYTDSGASQAQCVKVFEYESFNPSGTFTTQDWDGNDEGIAAIAVSGTLTMDETFTAASKGFVGSLGGHNATNNQGEGTGGAGSASDAANGNGASGSLGSVDVCGGNGGGHAAAGSVGNSSVSAGGQLLVLLI